MNKSIDILDYNATPITSHPIYKVLKRMINRCYYEPNGGYAKKGIGICDEWRKNSRAFIKWGLENGWKPGLSIDRIDNSKDYSPDNCRWATRKEQDRNKTNNVFITFGKKTMILHDWSNKLKLSTKIIKKCYKEGMTLKQIKEKYKKGD